MNAKLLQPAVQELFDHFKGQYRIKIEVAFDMAKNQDITSSATVFVGSGDELKLFYGSTCDEALARAKSEYKPVDKARVEAAKKLREQAKLIESGEIEIPNEN